MSRSVQVLVLIAALVAAPVAYAQAGTAGTIAGVVTLEGGEPAHGATIIVVGVRRTATTDDTGKFEITNVPAGAYEVIAQREHFTAPRQQVTVTANATVTAAFELVATSVHEEVTVTASASGTATAFESFNSVRTLDGVELAANRGATIADALATEPGVATRSFGAGSTRPVIRGFDGDRVLIMQDGVRTGDLSSQSGDHGVSIDPAGIERLEVVKGPATLLYGSNAIGGVVNAITPQDAFRTSPFTGILGGVSGDAGSGNAQGGINGNLQIGHGSWTVWANGGTRRTGDYDTPAGVVENSGTNLQNGRVGLGWNGSRLFVSAGAQVERSRFGVPFAGDFHQHVAEATGELLDAGALDVDIKSRRNDFRFDVGTRNFESAFIDTIKLTAAATRYAHEELEVVGGAESVATTFDNDTNSLRGELEQKRVGALTGRLGVEWMGRDFDTVGEEALAPPTAQRALSGFAYQELGFGRYRLQFGGRVERTTYRPGVRALNEEHDHGGEACGPAAPDVRDRDFTGGSGSFGIHTDVGEHNAFVANLTFASRAPALEELYNFGPHIGNLAFEIGNPNLELERTAGVDISFRSRVSRGSLEINGFMYHIDDFVFLSFTGEEVDGLREADYLQGDSRFAGMEASGDVEVGRGARVHGGVSFVNAMLTGTQEHLPRIPPLSGRVSLEVPVKNLTVTPEIVLTAAQRDVFRDETPTDGSTLFNLSATYLVVKGHATHSITLKAGNLTNEDYRLHTSFIKDLAPEMGRNVKVTYTAKFF